jgi:hypothetical protein
MAAAKKAAKKAAKVSSPAAATDKLPKQGEPITTNYAEISGKWWLLDDESKPVREITVVEEEAARAAGLIVPPTPPPVASNLEGAAPVVEAPLVATKAPRMETPHCATCIHYQAPKGVHQLDADEGVCAQTNQPVKAEDKCAKYAFNEEIGRASCRERV